VLAGPRLSTIVPAGVISPDGSTAALFRVRAGGQAALHLLSLDSGTDHAIPVHPNQESFALGAVAWSPDSQWLFVVTADGRIVAVSAKTGRVRGLGIGLPPVSQLAVR
jgi:WD40 repeat protein